MHDGNSDCTSSKFIQVLNYNGCLNRDGFLFAWGCVHRRVRKKIFEYIMNTYAQQRWLVPIDKVLKADLVDSSVTSFLKEKS